MAKQQVTKKAMSESKSLKSRQVYPQDTNHHHTMFGGTLMANVDEIAAITAMKHAGNSVVTASTDSVDFLLPIRTLVVVRWKYVCKLLLKMCSKVNEN